MVQCDLGSELTMALKKARRREAEDGLNITSMMDMMTIILVFLLKSLSLIHI